METSPAPPRTPAPPTTAAPPRRLASQAGQASVELIAALPKSPTGKVLKRELRGEQLPV